VTKLGNVHLQFRTISKYLIDKRWMSQAEEMWGFLHMLQPELENKVRQQLQITDLQHDPQDPYELRKLYEAAAYCLLGSAPAGSMGVIRSTTLLAPQPPPVNIKAELQTEVQSVIKSAATEMTEMFKNVFAAQVQFTSAVQASQLQACALTIVRLPQDQGSKCNFWPFHVQLQSGQQVCAYGQVQAQPQEQDSPALGGDSSLQHHWHLAVRLH
jgi:hypothetical protein